MKNFVRLVQFAWRYKVRFGLSIGCAAMVAILFFTELGAVYPLLHILFDSQNPQRWVSEKIAPLTARSCVHATNREAEVLMLRRIRAGSLSDHAQTAISRCSTMI